LIQGPATRFGDTAANAGVLALLQTTELPLPLQTACASAAAGVWRILLMPIDASKTAMQVQGSQGLTDLWSAVSEQGPGVLYRGALAQAAASAVGHFPWFVTYNSANAYLPPAETPLGNLVRGAALGWAASTVSDTTSNSLRVIKTTKQTALVTTGKDMSYQEIVSMILEQDGLKGLLGRGLSTRLLTNAIQGALFSVLWRYFQTLQETM
jgi:hypothetical protein